MTGVVREAADGEPSDPQRSSGFGPAGTAEAELRALLDHAPLGVALVDAELRLLRVNRFLSTLVGALPEDRHCVTLDALLPALADDLRPVLRQVLHGQRILDQEICLVREIPVPTLHLSASYYPVEHADGSIAGVGIVLIDVSARKEEEHFRDTFVGVLGHDLRTPLQSMVLSCDVALRQPDLPERARQRLHTLCDSAKRMGRMIEQILDLTRIRSGAGMPVSRRQTDLVRVVMEVVEEQRLLSPASRITVRAPATLVGLFDADRLAQVVGNLLGNAVRHGADESPIDVELSDAGGELRLSFSNRGPAIPDHVLEGLFEPFRKRREGRSKSLGLGLGLFIAREIVVAHGGDIAVQSSAEGTTFSVVLPRR